MDDDLQIIGEVQETMEKLRDLVNEGHVIGIQAQIFLDNGQTIITWPGEPISGLEKLGALELAKHTMLHIIDEEDDGGNELLW